jgi:nucleoside-diphosphate-sugar epimerase
MLRRVPAIEKLYGLTGFRPKTSLAEIIDRVAEYFRSKRAGEARSRAVAPSAV